MDHAESVAEHVGFEPGGHPDELVATVANDHVVGAKPRSQRVGDSDQQLVSRRVTPGVVHRLETVDIDECNHQLLILPPHPGDLAVQRQDTCATQICACERIERGSPPVALRDDSIGQCIVAIVLCVDAAISAGRTIHERLSAILFGLGTLPRRCQSILRRMHSIGCCCEPRLTRGLVAKWFSDPGEVHSLRRPPVSCIGSSVTSVAGEVTDIGGHVPHIACRVAPVCQHVSAVPRIVAKHSRPIPFVSGPIPGVRLCQVQWITVCRTAPLAGHGSPVTVHHDRRATHGRSAADVLVGVGSTSMRYLPIELDERRGSASPGWIATHSPNCSVKVRK